MFVVYFDSSALVKLIVEEAGTDVASALWDGCDAALSSRLAYPEVCAALAAGHRNHDVSDDGYARASRDWTDFWTAIRPVELTTDIERQAGVLAHRHALAALTPSTSQVPWPSIPTTCSSRYGIAGCTKAPSPSG